MDLTVAKRITNSLIKLRPKSDMYHLVNGKFTALSDDTGGGTTSTSVIECTNGKKGKCNNSVKNTSINSSKHGACGGYLSKLTKSISQDTIRTKKCTITPPKKLAHETDDKLPDTVNESICSTVDSTFITESSINISSHNVKESNKVHSKLKSTKSFGTYSVLHDALNINGVSIAAAIDEASSSSSSTKVNYASSSNTNGLKGSLQSSATSSSCAGATTVVDHSSQAPGCLVLNLTTNDYVFDGGQSRLRPKTRKNLNNHSVKLLRHSAIDPGCNKQYSFGQMEAYIRLDPLGEGSYATVYKGFSK